MSPEQLNFNFKDESRPPEVLAVGNPAESGEASKPTTKEVDAKDLFVGDFVIVNGQVVKLAERRTEGAGCRLFYVDPSGNSVIQSLDSDTDVVDYLQPQEQAFKVGWTQGDSNS